MMLNDEHFMQEALRQAKRAGEEDEVPVGAVVVHDGKIIARAFNQVETLKDPTAHAEMIAMTQATNTLSCKWLLDCTMYVTLEPCAMCAGALVLSRMKKLVIAARDPKAGACGSVLNIVQERALNHKVEVIQGPFEEEAGRMLTQFFERKRKTAKEL